MSRKLNDIVAGSILLVAAVVIFVSSNAIPKMVVTTVGPDFMPKFVAIGLGVFSLLLIFRSAALPPEGSDTAATGEETRPRSPREWIRTHTDLATVSLLFIYAFGIATIGFLTATAIYLYAQISLMGMNRKQNKLIVGGIALAISSGVYVVFTRFLYVMLPSGILG